ncbi:MAG: hypothetical protein AAGA68_26915 [Pseudomonadota bacterium]
MFVVYGRHGGFPAEVELSALLEPNGGDGTAGFVQVGLEPRTAVQVRAVGDVNGDGLADLSVGGLADGPVVYVWYGNAGPVPAERPFNALLIANGGNGSQGVALVADEGEELTLPTRIGDVDDDGFPDLALTAARGNPATENFGTTVYVLYGQEDPLPAEVVPAALLDQDAPRVVTLVRPPTQPVTLRPARATLDFNQDGVEDLVFSDSGGGLDSVYLAHGTAGLRPPLIDLGDLLPENGGDGRRGFVVRGNEETGRLDQSISTADVNADGRQTSWSRRLFADCRSATTWAPKPSSTVARDPCRRR